MLIFLKNFSLNLLSDKDQIPFRIRVQTKENGAFVTRGEV